MALLKVRDECTKLVGHRFLNSHICLVISLIQLLVCCWAVAQHVNSYLTHRKILYCDFLEGSLPLEAVDAVIFDVRLFHNLWGIRGCVAEYLDGGFGRLAWCVSHSTSLIFSIPATFLTHPRPYFFWPLLVQQSAYGICLLVLLLAALPRIVVVLAAPQAAPLAPILFYFIGTALNFFHLYVYWHWYWHVSSMWNSAVRVKFGQRLVNANNRSRKDRPRVPKEQIDDAVLHYVPGNQAERNEENQINPKIILPSIQEVSTTHIAPSEPSNQIANNYRGQRSCSSKNRRQHVTKREEEEDGGDEADVDELPTPPPPIFATRLTRDSYENRKLAEEAERRIRRKLPLTPNLPMHGELRVVRL